MDTRKWGYTAFGIGLVLAVIFFPVALAVKDGGLKSGFAAAAVVCLVAAVNGLAVGLSGDAKTGRWAGLIAGAIGFVALGIAWLTKSCTSGDLDCSNVKDMLGWMALFSGIGGLGSIAPQLFYGVKF